MLAKTKAAQVDRLYVRRVSNGFVVQSEEYTVPENTYVAVDVFDLYEILVQLFIDGKVE